MSNATKAQTKASEAYVEAIDKRVDSELAESHNAQRQSFWKDQKSRRILGDVLTYVLLTVLGIIWLLPIVWIFLESLNKNTAPFTDTFFPTQYSFDSYVTLFTQRTRLPAHVHEHVHHCSLHLHHLRVLRALRCLRDEPHAFPRP